MIAAIDQFRHLANAYRALRAGKHPDDLTQMLEMMEEETQHEVIREFAQDAQELVGSNVKGFEMEKEGVDISKEATVFFHLGVAWERHDIFTGDDLRNGDSLDTGGER